MTTFTTHTLDSAPAAARPLLERAQRAFGFLPNMLGIMAEAPKVLEAYLTLSGLYGQTSLSRAEQEVVALATSVGNGCEFCVAAHSVIGEQMAGLDGASVAALRRGELPANPRHAALATLVRRAQDSRGRLTETEIQAFLAAGFSPAQVQEVLLGVALLTLSNFVNNTSHPTLNPEFQPGLWQAAA